MVLNGNPIPGANSNSYTPTVAGNYTVRITVGSCAPATTPIYKVFTCLQETNKSITVCEGFQAIIPEFTSSTQAYVASTVTIVTPPANGTAVIDPNGVIIYTRISDLQVQIPLFINSVAMIPNLQTASKLL